MFRTTLVCLAKTAQAGEKLTVHNNPYKVQKKWPPDFTKLSQKYQFGLERRYRRRSKLKWARPGWVKGVKLSSYGICGFVLVYAVLFMDWKTEMGQDDQPFQGIRDVFWNQVNSVWSTSSRPIPDRATVARRGNASEQ